MTVTPSENSCSPNAVANCIKRSSLQSSETSVLEVIREQIHSISKSQRTKKANHHRLKLALKATPKGPLQINCPLMIKRRARTYAFPVKGPMIMIGRARTSIRRLSDRNAKMKTLINILRLK
jgi:hypothetical protein